MLRGLKNVRDVGKVLEVDGETEMSAWDGETCNQIVGTDGLLLNPFQSKKEPLSMFIRPICASMHLSPARKASYRGIDTYVFTKEFEDFSVNNLTCFCRRPNECPVRGTMDLFPCVQVPVTISLPHFYQADPSLLENIASGLKPVKEKHEFYINMELVGILRFFSSLLRFSHFVDYFRIQVLLYAPLVASK